MTCLAFLHPGPLLRGGLTRSIALAAAALLAAGLAAAPARAAIVSAYDTPPDPAGTGEYYWPINLVSAKGVYFTAEASGTLSSVTTYMRGSGSSDTQVTLQLHVWDPANSALLDVLATSAPLTFIGETSAPRTFTAWDAAPSLEEGNHYAVMAHVTSGPGWGPVAWTEVDPSVQVPAGTGPLYYHTIVGWLFDGPVHAMRVEVEADPAPVPLPATLPLLGVGMLALVGFARRRC